MTPTRRRLAVVVLTVLAAAASGCCGDETTEVEEHHTGRVSGEVLDQIRTENATDDERCDAACIVVAEAGAQGDTPDDVVSCLATVEGSDAPWDPAHDEVQIECRAEYIRGTFCTGRRPQGHREAAIEVCDRGAWFAVHAHLEAASVAAFDDLATWLERRDAPDDLVARCRAAAAEEVVHAGLMRALAERDGAAVPPCDAEPADDALLAVALHNAVEGCVNESFAALVAAHQATRAEHGRGVFAILATDELRHGQLAWDLHEWLIEQLSDEEREVVARAQAIAFAELPARAADNARRTPAGLGWPDAERAATMARMFAAQLGAA
jgi:hypothetical protein